MFNKIQFVSYRTLQCCAALVALKMIVFSVLFCNYISTILLSFTIAT